jgi:hypothetical protein
VRRTAGLILAIGVVAVGTFVYRNWSRRFGPGDYVEAAQQATVAEKKSNLSVLTDACESVQWQHSKTDEGKHVVEAAGALKKGGRSVVVRWEVTIVRDRNLTVQVANPVFASVGGEEVQPAKDYPSKLAGVGP